MVDFTTATPIRVLIVEDDVPTAYAFRTRFTNLGYVVDEAPSALHAIQMLCDHRYAAVLLDLVMPGPMNGFAVISFLETEQPDMIERLVIVSGMPEQTIMHAAPQLLPRFYRKPFDLEKVVATIDRRIRGVAGTANGERILVADDDADFRLMTTYMAKSIGRETVEVVDGHDAIRELAESDFAVVLIDLLMPYVDGYGVLRYLREERPHLLQRTIVFTGMPARFRHNPLLESAGLVLEKPGDASIIRETLQRFLHAGNHIRA